ncbi:MAG: Ig-like domain-containing protein [Actinomycetota bacterium]|nr:Ig-like domain-containing protein [Actinomycetota bacterium]
MAKGTITDISLVSPSGYQVNGALSKDKSSWTTGEVLGYGKTYQLTGSAVGTDGKTVPITGKYTMLKPAKLARTTISPGDGAVVGVAMPVMIQFLTTTPQDRALIEKNVSITTTPKVNGAWAWIDHDGGIWGLDYRPKGYWPAGTKVHVEAKMYGLKFAARSYGKTDVSSSFTIGRNQVVIANANAHKIVVQRNGHTVATYPASYGAAKDTDTSPGHTATDRQTHSGIHVVNDLRKDLTMTSPLFKYSEKEKWAVRISDNGEFIHANPNTINQQGHANVSHGCINLSLKAAEAYFRSAIVGDPVQVTGTNVRLGPADGDIFDYAINWDTWVGLSGKNG